MIAPEQWTDLLEAARAIMVRNDCPACRGTRTIDVLEYDSASDEMEVSGFRACTVCVTPETFTSVGLRWICYENKWEAYADWSNVREPVRFREKTHEQALNYLHRELIRLRKERQ